MARPFIANLCACGRAHGGPVPLGCDAAAPASTDGTGALGGAAQEARCCGRHP